MEGIRRDNEQIEKTVNNPEKPTFDNTIINSDDDKEGYYDLLSRVSAVFFNLLSAETNDEMDALAQKMQPILTKHANDVRLNPRLFERVRHVYRHHRTLTQEEKMLLDSSYDGFVRSGALLDDEGKEKLRKLTEEAGMLSLQFSQNLLKENKAFKLHITDSQQLDGLPETAIEAAAAEASEEGKEGWVFTLDYPSYSPFMTYSTQRELRERMYMAKNTECTHDNPENNIDICKRLINLRLEIARLLGYKSYADYVLKHRMAGNTKNVYKLLDDLIEAKLLYSRHDLPQLRVGELARYRRSDDRINMLFFLQKLYRIENEGLIRQRAERAAIHARAAGDALFVVDGCGLVLAHRDRLYLAGVLAGALTADYSGVGAVDAAFLVDMGMMMLIMRYRAFGTCILTAMCDTSAAVVGDNISARRAVVTGNVERLDNVRIFSVAAGRKLDALGQNSPLLIHTAAHGGHLAWDYLLRYIKYRFCEIAFPCMLGYCAQHLVFQMLDFGVKLVHKFPSSHLFVLILKRNSRFVNSKFLNAVNYFSTLRINTAARDVPSRRRKASGCSAMVSKPALR